MTAEVADPAPSTRWAHLLPCGYRSALRHAVICTSKRRQPKWPLASLILGLQSLDGSIATSLRKALPLSGDTSMLMTHALRAAHDAILVGIGTVLSDDPQLNARFPKMAERQPQPVILDPHLRFPTTARLLKIAQPWIYCNEPVDPHRRAALEAQGALVTVMPVPEQPDVHRMAVAAVLRDVRRRGIHSVMVEGGSTIIGYLLQTTGLVNRVVITVAPVLVGGLRISYEPESSRHGGGMFRRLENVRYDIVDGDVVVSGTPSATLALPQRT